MKTPIKPTSQPTVLSPEPSSVLEDHHAHPARLKIYIISATDGHLPGEIVTYPYDQAMSLINNNLARRA